MFGPAAEGCESVSALISEDKPVEIPEIQYDVKKDIIVMPYSSGTTGLPKGVEITSYNFIACVLQLRWTTLISIWYHIAWWDIDDQPCCDTLTYKSSSGYSYVPCCDTHLPTSLAQGKGMSLLWHTPTYKSSIGYSYVPCCDTPTYKSSTRYSYVPCCYTHLPKILVQGIVMSPVVTHTYLQV